MRLVEQLAQERQTFERKRQELREQSGEKSESLEAVGILGVCG